EHVSGLTPAAQLCAPPHRAKEPVGKRLCSAEQHFDVLHHIGEIASAETLRQLCTLDLSYAGLGYGVPLDGQQIVGTHPDPLPDCPPDLFDQLQRHRSGTGRWMKKDREAVRVR